MPCLPVEEASTRPFSSVTCTQLSPLAMRTARLTPEYTRRGTTGALAFGAGLPDAEVVVLDPADDTGPDVGAAAQVLDRKALLGTGLGQAGADTVGALDDRHPSPSGRLGATTRTCLILGADCADFRSHHARSAEATE